MFTWYLITPSYFTGFSLSHFRSRAYYLSIYIYWNYHILKVWKDFLTGIKVVIFKIWSFAKDLVFLKFYKANTCVKMRLCNANKIPVDIFLQCCFCFSDSGIKNREIERSFPIRVISESNALVKNPSESLTKISQISAYQLHP